MSNLSDGIQQLVATSEAKGYLTFDDIMDVSDALSLNFTDVDRLSEALQLRGVIVYETEPTAPESKDSLEDYSRVDYDAIFSEITSMSDSLLPLVKQVKELPPPQYGEIHLLTSQVANGNEYARDRLITIHVRNALKIALALSKQYDYDIEDAISAGLNGLCVAVDKFDPNGFSAFQSYASMWIQQHIHRDCRPSFIKFYYPAHYMTDLLSVYTVYKNHNCSHCRSGKLCSVLIAEVATKCNFSEDNAKSYLASLMQQLTIMDIDSFADDDENLASALIVETTTFDLVATKELSALCEAVINTLKDREADIVRLRYGFETGEPLTLEEVGKIYGLTRERIRQIESKAFKKLQHPTRKQMLKDFY